MTGPLLAPLAALKHSVSETAAVPQSPDGGVLMSGGLPMDNKESALQPEKLYRSGLLADNFFQPKGRCSTPSDISERAITRCGHSESPGEAKKLALSQAPTDFKLQVGTDGALETSGGDKDGVSAGEQASLASTLPTELLHMIYRQLGATDFDAARRACSRWYLASLDHDLLVEQLKRGGWWRAASAQLFEATKKPPITALSGCLARECALAGDWTGQELRDVDCTRCKNPMMESAQVDFRAMMPRDAGYPTDLCCTTSLCGRYFLFASGSVIYTYEILPDRLLLLSRTPCEKRVLAMAIEVSADRFAIAALLEGRIGVYIDLMGTASSPPPTSQ